MSETQKRLTVWQTIKVTLFQTWALNVLVWSTPDDDVNTFLALHSLAQAMLDDENGRLAGSKP